MLCLSYIFYKWHFYFITLIWIQHALKQSSYLLWWYKQMQRICCSFYRELPIPGSYIESYQCVQKSLLHIVWKCTLFESPTHETATLCSHKYIKTAYHPLLLFQKAIHTEMYNTHGHMVAGNPSKCRLTCAWQCLIWLALHMRLLTSVMHNVSITRNLTGSPNNKVFDWLSSWDY